MTRFDGRRWNLPSRIYSDLRSSMKATARRRRGSSKLGRLLYQREPGAPTHAGRFRAQGTTVEVWTRDFRYRAGSFADSSLAWIFPAERFDRIRDGFGDPVAALVLEPERLGAVFGEEYEDRTPVRLAELPRSLTDAILVTEDRDFCQHAGVSVRRILGAMAANLKGGAKQGGSTLTQQLVKSLYLSPERTVRRKIVETILSLILDARYSKDEIFEAYLNRDLSGPRGADRDHGHRGSRAALLRKSGRSRSGGVRGDRRHDPRPQRVLADPETRSAPNQRRDLVLKLMREEKKIGDSQLAAAVAEPLGPPARLASRTIAPHFVDLVKSELSLTATAKS